jgi:hypothetical protein
MVHLGAYGPMRPEEPAGLRHRDVDLDSLRARVRPAPAPGLVLPAFLRRELCRHLESCALLTRSGVTLKDAMVRVGQSSEKVALIYQHSDDDRQQEVAAGLDATVRKARQEAATVPEGETAEPDDQASGANLARDR